MSEWVFLEPKCLWLLILVLPAAAVRWLADYRRRKDQACFSEPELFERLNPGARTRSSWLGTLTAALGLGFLVLAAARPAGHPQMVEEETSRAGVDIMLAVDLSSSMKATDLAPSRMQAAKAALKAFIDSLAGDRIGMTIFAGSVSLQSPLTLDYRTAKMMVDIINTDFLPVDGTALGDALNYALNKIGAEERKRAVIVLLTDGENTKGGDPLEAAIRAKTAGTKVYTVGIGTPEGTTIPDGIDEAGRPKVKMYQGQPVVTKLDEETLQRIADETGGRYYPARSSEGLLQAYQEISRLTKTTHTEKRKTFKYREYFVWLLVPGLLLVLADAGFGRRKDRSARHAA